MHHVSVKNGNFALNVETRKNGCVIKKLKFIENVFFRVGIEAQIVIEIQLKNKISGVSNYTPPNFP